MSRNRLAPRALSLILPLLVAVSLLCFRPPVLSAAPDSKDAVTITATADKPDADGKQTVTLTLAIDAGWHLYANPVGNEDLKSVQTVVKALTLPAIPDMKPAINAVIPSPSRPGPQ